MSLGKSGTTSFSDDMIQPSSWPIESSTMLDHELNHHSKAQQTSEYLRLNVLRTLLYTMLTGWPFLYVSDHSSLESRHVILDGNPVFSF